MSDIALLRDLEQDEFLKHITEIIHTYVNISFLMFFVLDSDGEWVKFRTGTSGETTNFLLTKGYQLKAGMAVFVDKIGLQSRNIFIYSLPTEAQNNLDIQLKEDQVPNYFSPLLPETRSLLSLPLRFRGKLVGAWHICSSRDEGFELEDILHFQLLADQIAVRLFLLSR
ncbi:MAG: GAF domain-containing protein [Chloroflexi bacterium]|nr:GAF domain-containing protein [Chloroflexota bacterium]